MKLTTAIAAGFGTFKAVLGTPRVGGSVPGASTEALRVWDEITNGWAAVRAGFGAFWGALRQWGGVEYADLAAAAAANPHAGRGLRLICDNGAALPVVGYRSAQDGDSADEAFPEMKALQAIERSGWESLWTPFVWGAYCGGEAFFRRLAPETGPNRGKTRRIEALRNDRFVRIDRHDDGDPKTYVFSRVHGAGTEEIPAEEVLHVRFFNPGDPERGLPILISARRALTMVEEADVWNRGISRGGGRVPLYFTPTNLADGKTLDRETQVKPAQESSDQAHRERAMSNLPMFLNGAFKPERADISPKDADWLKGRTVAMREIAAVLGVPATLLADEKAGSLTDAGVDSEIAALFKLTIHPLVTRLLQEFTAWLCEEGQRLDADWDLVPALQEDIDAKYLRYTAASQPGGPLTKKEARVALGYDAEPAADMVDDAPMLPAGAPPDVPPSGDDETIKGLRDLSGPAFRALTMKLVA